MKTLSKLEKELQTFEKKFLSKVNGGEQSGDNCVSTPHPNGTNCVKMYGDTYNGSEYCGVDQGWHCEDSYTPQD